MFLVLANVAEVRAGGDAGDDLFTVRAFALAAGGYLEHGIVDVDGGNGFDKVIGLGTELADAYGVQRLRLVGGGTTAVSTHDRGAGARHPGRRRRPVRRRDHGRRAHPGHRRPRQRRVHRARRSHPPARGCRRQRDPAAGAGPLALAAARPAGDRGRRQRRRSPPADGPAAAAGDGHPRCRRCRSIPPENQQIDILDVHDDDFADGRDRGADRHQPVVGRRGRRRLRRDRFRRAERRRPPASPSARSAWCRRALRAVHRGSPPIRTCPRSRC